MSRTTFVVDDSDSRIRYEGNWSKSYHVNSSGEKSVIPFRGTRSSIAAFGSNHSSPQRNQKRNNSDRFTCYVDKIPIPPPAPPEVQNYLCGNNTLDDGHHHFELHISKQDPSLIFLDYLEVTSDSTSPQSNTIKILGNDTSVIMPNGNWTPVEDNSTSIETNSTGASVTINFTGTSLTWVGSNPHSSPPARVNGSYNIDGERNKSFSDDVNERDQIFFVARKRSNQNHTVIVTYEGNSTTNPPLVLDYLYVETGPIPRVPSTKHSPPAPKTPPSAVPPAPTAASTKSKIDAGQIAGGVIGGVVFLLAALALFLFLTRRRRRSATFHRQWQYRQSDISVREPLSDGQGQARGRLRDSAALTLANGFGYNSATIEQTRAIRKGEEAARESGRYVNRGRTSGSHFTDPLPLYNAT
ncbi:hypothetical protein C0993_004659 [Termitomyces sp. T159_Od127]|nr:hypothetical protein C0993_004659 [Termitomyces sp. T159_Od127]